MRGTFGGDFNLADLYPTAKLKSLPIPLFYLKSKLILMMNELFCQTKYPPICFYSQTAKLNVCQMYHSYDILSSVELHF